MITRMELLERVRRSGCIVEERTLMHWESSGVIPRPVRRYHNGAPRALYPDGWEETIILVRHLRDRGKSLKEIQSEISQARTPPTFVPVSLL